MAIVINGSGTVTGISVGGLPDGIVDAGTLATDSVTAAKLKDDAIATGDLPAGSVVQVVHTQDGSHATGTTAMVLDDSIPTITEGTEFMTLDITPTNALNILRIEVTSNLNGNGSGDNNIINGALFVGTTTAALAACFINADSVANRVNSTGNLIHEVVAGGTSALTFRFRAGLVSSGTIAFNGHSDARTFGGVMASTMTITEIAV